LYEETPAPTSVGAVQEMANFQLLDALMEISAISTLVGIPGADPEYVKKVRALCDEKKMLLVFDEVQTGMGRTGKWFAFQHYEVEPDLVCLGKGITSSLPLSAVIGKKEIIDIYNPGEMTSTHSGNPICTVAAIASIDKIVKDRLVENACKMGDVLFKGLDDLKNKYKDFIGAVHGKGLVAGVQTIKKGGIGPDGELAFNVISRCVEKGLLMFAPVGFGGATIKISPPLIINEEAVKEGIKVLDEVFEEVLQER